MRQRLNIKTNSNYLTFQRIKWSLFSDRHDGFLYSIEFITNNNPAY